MTGHDSNWTELNAFQRDCLQAVLRLANRDGAGVSGQDIRRELESDYERVSHGRLYPNLDDLVDAGLLDKGTLDRRTNDYRPTTAAEELVRRELQSWMAAVETDQVLADGGPRVRYCRDCESVHPGDAVCKPWDSTSTDK